MRHWLSAALLLTGCGSRPAVETFRDAAAESGLVFEHDPKLSGQFQMPEIMGAGCALFDYDNDGDLDAYLVQSNGGSRLFRNELAPSGKLRFTDVTASCNCSHAGYGMGAATGDFDGDGFTDLYVTASGANALYRNRGNGTFEDVTAQAGVGDPRWSTSAAFLDYNRDGRLDLFVLNYVDFSAANNKPCFAPTGERDYCTPRVYNAVNASLFRNEGGGRFMDVSQAAGITAARGPGLGVVVTDANSDGWVDLYVANDSAANILWVNQKDGTFKEQGLESGAAYSEDGLAKAGMGVSAGDYDNDGDDDLFVVNLTREGATLFRRDGPLLYQDVSLATGLRPATYSFTGFGTDWIDYDNDGWLDVFIANGAVTLMEELRGQKFPFQQTNTLLRSEEGRRYVDVSAESGRAMALKEVSRGAAFGDIDNDGDTDILVTNNSGPVRLLLNEVGNRSRWVRLRYNGAPGARIGLIRKGAPALWRRAHTDSSYLSASDPRVLFGLGGAAAIDHVEVQAADGTLRRFPPPPLNAETVLK